MARLNCYIPDSINYMLDKIKKETNINKRDIVILSVRQFYKSLEVDELFNISIDESAKNTS